MPLSTDSAHAAFPGDELLCMDPAALPRRWAPVRPGRALAALAAATAAPAAGPFDDEDDDEPDDGNVYADGVGVVCIDGPLMQRGGWWFDGYAAVAERFQAALTRPDCRVVVLKINSPGGVAAGCFEAARQMRADASAVGKPVLAYVDEMACSAAYALGCVADPGGLWLPPSGAVGSVGVVATYLDASEAMREMGMRHVILTSGKAKADGHYAQPIDRAMTERLRKPVDHLASLFFAWVSERRRMRPEAVQALDAEVFWGAGAVAVGLADRQASLVDCLAAARRLAAAPNPMAAASAALPARAPALETPMPDPTPAPVEPAAIAAAAAEPVAAGPLVESAPSVPLAEHQTLVSALEARAASAAVALAAVTSERDALAAQHKALVDKYAASERARISAKVDALVGPKLTPAERDEHLEMALENEARFDRLMQKRPALNLTGERVIADTGNEVRVTDAADSTAKLNALANAYIQAHPGTPVHEALRAVMRERPDLCAPPA